MFNKILPHKKITIKTLFEFEKTPFNIFMGFLKLPYLRNNSDTTWPTLSGTKIPDSWIYESWICGKRLCSGIKLIMGSDLYNKYILKIITVD